MIKVFVMKKYSLLLFLFVFLSAFFSCRDKQTWFNQHTVLPKNASLNEIVDIAAHVVPSDLQLEYMGYEYISFIHYSPNVFTNKEWGDGTEDPAVFNPTQFDARQWARVVKESGSKMLILTCKHHDGFCLWPSKYTEHSVKNSSWKNGEGDMVKEIAEACKEIGLKFGVYLSPWDRHEQSYGTDSYNEFFKNQLTELLSNYGEISVAWFDGAHGKGVKSDFYDWTGIFELIRKLQPNCIISNMGPDVRWNGTENGTSREEEWNVIPIADKNPMFNMTSSKVNPQAKVLGNRKQLENANNLAWYPSRATTSIRPGWFYHQSEDLLVKPASKLLDIYYQTVGRNATLLLSFPPDERGLIHEKDIANIKEWRKILDETFDENLAIKAKVSASSCRGIKYQGKNVVDEDAKSFWATDDGITSATLEFDLGEPIEFNVLMMQEYDAWGQRIEQWHAEYFENRQWKEIARGTTIGHKRLKRFPMIKASKVKLVISQSRVAPTIVNFGLFKAPEQLCAPIIFRDQEDMVHIKANSPNIITRYTTDGSVVTSESSEYINPFLFEGKGLVNAATFGSASGSFKIKGEQTTKLFDISKSKWKVFSAGDPNGKVQEAIDGNPGSVYFYKAKDNKSIHPFTIDMGEVNTLKGFHYAPYIDSKMKGIWLVYKFNLESSLNGKDWRTEIENGEFSNILNNPITQKIFFNNPIKAKYLRFTPTKIDEEVRIVGIAEIGVFTVE
jgi:alpha-L-fucosidase